MKQQSEALETTESASSSSHLVMGAFISSVALIQRCCCRLWYSARELSPSQSAPFGFVEWLFSGAYQPLP